MTFNRLVLFLLHLTCDRVPHVLHLYNSLTSYVDDTSTAMPTEDVTTWIQTEGNITTAGSTADLITSGTGKPKTSINVVRISFFSLEAVS